MILALRNAIRRSFERNPIKVTPYMITKRDLADLGHAKCHWCSEVPEGGPKWLVNGWAVCSDWHLADVIAQAADFNRHHGIWLG